MSTEKTAKDFLQSRQTPPLLVLIVWLDIRRVSITVNITVVARYHRKFANSTGKTLLPERSRIRSWIHFSLKTWKAPAVVTSTLQLEKKKRSNNKKKIINFNNTSVTGKLIDMRT